jgi:hypothetical protein
VRAAAIEAAIEAADGISRALGFDEAATSTRPAAPPPTRRSGSPATPARQP